MREVGAPGDRVADESTAEDSTADGSEADETGDDAGSPVGTEPTHRRGFVGADHVAAEHGPRPAVDRGADHPGRRPPLLLRMGPDERPGARPRPRRLAVRLLVAGLHPEQHLVDVLAPAGGHRRRACAGSVLHGVADRLAGRRSRPCPHPMGPGADRGPGRRDDRAGGARHPRGPRPPSHPLRVDRRAGRARW